MMCVAFKKKFASSSFNNAAYRKKKDTIKTYTVHLYIWICVLYI